VKNARDTTDDLHGVVVGFLNCTRCPDGRKKRTPKKAWMGVDIER
jgi:hypothetical protein